MERGGLCFLATGSKGRRATKKIGTRGCNLCEAKSDRHSRTPQLAFRLTEGK